MFKNGYFYSELGDTHEAHPRAGRRLVNQKLLPLGLRSNSAMEKTESAQGPSGSSGDVGSPRETGAKTGGAKPLLKAEVAVLGGNVAFEGYSSTSEIYSGVRSLCQEAGVISPSTTIRLHRPGAPQDCLLSRNADMMTEALLAGARGCWHVSKLEEDGSLVSLAASDRATRHIRLSPKEPPPT